MNCSLKCVLAAFVTSVIPSLPIALAQTGFVDQVVVSDWNQAVGVRFGPDARGYVWEKGGRVWLVENGVKSAQPLVDISEEVGDWRDFGLLGFVIDPNFDTNGYIYLLYVVDYHHARHFGTPQYNPQTDEYFRDTIARLTRYTANQADGRRTVDYASRLILVGENLQSGFPVCHQSHSIGSLWFGEDGTLLAGNGDGASYEEVDNGGPRSGSSNTALAEGIIRPAEDVGAFRSQLVDSLSGKIIRIDPATGNGLPSNPFYDAANPRSPRSRVWAMGFRNPFRWCMRPNTGNPNPGAADPGTIVLGDVGWYTREECTVIRSPGGNCGWPIFEGLTLAPGYASVAPMNLDAPNPLAAQPGCDDFFRFTNLLVQETLAAPSWPNPCNAAQQVPSSIPRFEHVRPVLDWRDGVAPRVAIFSGNNAAEVDITNSQSPIQGSPFGGTSSTGGCFYTGTTFPPEYHGTYFFADFTGGWIRNLAFDSTDAPTQLRSFKDNAGAIVSLAMNPADGALYYINYDNQGVAALRRIQFTNDQPPVAVANATPRFGSLPLTVQFSSAGSNDPEQLPLTYLWEFGDSSPSSTAPNPTHTFENTEDITSLGTIVARIFSLNPPNPIGGGNWDPEIIRDGDYPPVGNFEDDRQYDTYHAGDQGTSDWIGYTFPTTRQIRRVIFQEGKHFGDGGWFDTLRVQLLIGGVWVNAGGSSIQPAYPFVNDGENYETYILSFNPTNATGVRIIGNPGGSANFISVGELRVIANPLVPNVPRRFDVRLTVTDDTGQSASTMIPVWGNNTPPVVTITSPLDGATIPAGQNTTVPLTAVFSDAEHPPAQLSCAWEVMLHHNEHVHPEPIDTNCQTSAILTPHGGPADTFFYECALTVTDALGLSTRVANNVYAQSLCDSVDFNNDTSLFDPQDIDAFLSVYSEGPCVPATATCNDIDFNNDGSLFDPCDIDSFLLQFSEGPCTPCGQ